MARIPAQSRSPQPIQPLIHPARDTATMLNLSDWTVRELYRKGKLHGLRVKGRLMFRMTDIQAFLRESESPYEPNGTSVGARFQDRAIAARKAAAEQRTATQKVTPRKRKAVD